MNQRRSLIVLLICAILVVAVVSYGQARKQDKAKDPVCGLMVDKNPALSATYKGETYYFCLQRDLDTFKKNPERYARKK
jgi:YHS domain-containing protein